MMATEIPNAITEQRAEMQCLEAQIVSMRYPTVKVRFMINGQFVSYLNGVECDDERNADLNKELSA